MRPLILPVLLLLLLALACNGSAGRTPPLPTAVGSTLAAPTAAPMPVPATATPTAVPPALTPTEPMATTRSATTTPPPSPVSTPGPVSPLVRVGDATFTVEVVATVAQRSQGLSGRPSLDQGTGMLFVFDGEGQYSFWMKEMRFPLDILWIDTQCTVADISFNVPTPEPGQTLPELARFSPSRPVQFVLEINAGGAEQTGIAGGDAVAFLGNLEGLYIC